MPARKAVPPPRVEALVERVARLCDEGAWSSVGEDVLAELKEIQRVMDARAEELRAAGLDGPAFFHREDTRRLVGVVETIVLEMVDKAEDVSRRVDDLETEKETLESEARGLEKAREELQKEADDRAQDVDWLKDELEGVASRLRDGEDLDREAVARNVDKVLAKIGGRR